MRRSLSLLILCAIACGDDGLSGPAVLQIAGQWSFSESYIDTPSATTCNNTATVTFAQSGANFSGSSQQSGTCTDATGAFSNNSGTFQLRNGQVDGEHVSWNDDGAPVCLYSGTIVGTPPNAMSGSVSCVGISDGVSFNIEGTWQMSR